MKKAKVVAMTLLVIIGTMILAGCESDKERKAREFNDQIMQNQKK
jgi:outer membrane murein-binding lipoprotein Lpp